MLITTNKSCVAHYLSVFIKKGAGGYAIYYFVGSSDELTFATST